MTVVVGISGKIGSGKNYLADRLIEEYSRRGLKAGFSSFATPLKAELSQIIQSLPGPDESIAASYNMPLKQAQKLRELLAADYAARGLSLTAYDRTEGVRRALQYLGTDIRRAVDQQYWVNLFKRAVDRTLDFALVTDVRFPNEADAMIDMSGVILRLEVPEEVILDRTRNRDGLLYSAEALAHPSETALDDYPKFDFVIGSDFDVTNVANRIMSVASDRRS